MKTTNCNLTKTKQNNDHFLSCFVILLTITSTSVASERIPWTFGHGDFQVDYGNNEWLFQIHLDEYSSDFAPDEVVIVLGEPAKLYLPDNPSFSFLGETGAPVWVAPQGSESVASVPRVGFESDSNGAFQDSRITLELVSVTGPGSFAGWTTATGSQEVLMNSQGGIDGNDVIENIEHFHMNMGFTAPGTYEVGFRASGTLIGESSLIVSDEQLFQFEVSVFKEGELDLEVAFEDDELEIAFLDEASEAEYAAEEIALHLGPNTWQRVPAGAEFSFLGSTSDELYILPQTEREGVLFLGIAGDEIPGSIFVNEVVDLQLNSLDGPGDVFIYSTDAFGSPSVFLNSSDGIDANDALPIEVGSHMHVNWAFSEPGIYRVGVNASGTLASSSEAVSTETVELIFEVFAPTIVEEGEYDIEVVYEEGEWEIAVLDEANELEYSPDEVVFSAESESRQTIDPTLGLNADSLYIFPQTENPALPFIGVAGDEIESGVFQDEKVTFELVSLSGPGDFFLYALDSFGNPVGGAPYFDSSNGIDTSDVFPVAVGSHSHLNWGFSAPGVYRVGVQASGTLVEGGAMIGSAMVELTFEVRPAESFLIGFSHEENMLVLNWDSKTGSTYQLQSRAEISTGDWQKQGDPVAGDGTSKSVEIQMIGQASKFFRILEE